MKNKAIGVPISDQDLKNILGGYADPEFCSVECNFLESYACCNKGRCRCVDSSVEASCQTGGQGSSTCFWHWAMPPSSTFEQP